MQQNAIGLGIATFFQVLPGTFRVATKFLQLQLQMHPFLIG